MEERMRLFITGAAGYIGFDVATTFRRAGYTVWGLTRSQERAFLLACNEINPVIGSLQEPDSFQAIAAESEVIVHAATDYQADSAVVDTATVKTLLDAARSSPTPRTFIYTSGVWVYGDTNGRSVTEQVPPAPAQAVAWRPAVEQMVLNAKGVQGIVIRPGVVYGKGGGLTGLWFQSVSNGGVLQVVGDGYNHWAMVHVDDLAQGCLRAAQSNTSGQVFNLVDPSRATVMELAGAAAQAVGTIRQLEFIPVDKAAQEMGAMAAALALDQVVDATKARRLLDWQPKHKGFIAEADVYFRAWQANQQSTGEL
jgi:nucleoside-diphosphate-sugar epimerase